MSRVLSRRLEALVVVRNCSYRVRSRLLLSRPPRIVVRGMRSRRR